VIGPCFYGIDLAGEEELIAAGRTVEEVRAHIGATSLAYLSLEGLQESTRRPESTLCRACLGGDYPTRIPAARRLAKLRFEPRVGEPLVPPRAPSLRAVPPVQAVAEPAAVLPTPVLPLRS